MASIVTGRQNVFHTSSDLTDTLFEALSLRQMHRIFRTSRCRCSEASWLLNGSVPDFTHHLRNEQRTPWKL